MRFAIPLLAALAMITLVACGGDDDEETAAPVPAAQRFVTEEDAPGSKPDPDETRQTVEDLDAFIVGLSELAVDPDKEEATTVFEEAGFKGAGVDTRFYGEAHTPGVSPHVVSSFMELGSEDGAASALDWLEADSKKPCPRSCAVQISTFDVDEFLGRAASAASQRPRTSRGSEPKINVPPTAIGWHSATVRLFTTWICLGRRGPYPRSRLWISQARITTGLQAASARNGLSPQRTASRSVASRSLSVPPVRITEAATSEVRAAHERDLRADQ